MADCLNEASRTGSFPDCFKTGNIVSVCKTNDPSVPLLSKVFKSLIFDQSANCANSFPKKI